MMPASRNTSSSTSSAFRNDAENCVAGLASRPLADGFKHFFKPCDLLLGLVVVVYECLLQFFIRTVFCKFRQRLELTVSRQNRGPGEGRKKVLPWIA
jgi:hypothetical protein